MGVAHAFQSRPVNTAADPRTLQQLKQLSIQNPERWFSFVSSLAMPLSGGAITLTTLTGKMLLRSSLQYLSPMVVCKHMQTSSEVYSGLSDMLRSLIPEVAIDKNLRWLRLVLTTPCDGWTSRCEDVLKLLQLEQFYSHPSRCQSWSHLDLFKNAGCPQTQSYRHNLFLWPLYDFLRVKDSFFFPIFKTYPFVHSSSPSTCVGSTPRCTAAKHDEFWLFDLG